MARPSLRRTDKLGGLRAIFLSQALQATTPPSLLTSLPREVQIRILHFLPPPTQVSLGLSCPDMFPLVGDLNTGALSTILTGNDTYTLCCSLSIDRPRYLACFGCKRLHKRDTEEIPYILQGIPYRLCPNNIPASPTPCQQYTLSYEMLDLALRFDQLSSAHGLPLHILAHQCDTDDHRHGAGLPFKVDILPRICDGRLLLRIDSFVKVDCSNEFALGDQVQQIPFLPCVHMLRIRFELCCSLNLRLGTIKRWERWCAMERCTDCATDASSRLIYNKYGSEVDSLQVRVWKDFGGRGRAGEQPWTGHISPMHSTERAVYKSGDKHLGNVFDGYSPDQEEYHRKISLDDGDALRSG